MRDLSTTLCLGLTLLVLATVPSRTRVPVNGYPVVKGLPVPTDDLIPVAGLLQAALPDCPSPPHQPPHPLLSTGDAPPPRGPDDPPLPTWPHPALRCPPPLPPSFPLSPRLR